MNVPGASPEVQRAINALEQRIRDLEKQSNRAIEDSLEDLRNDVEDLKKPKRKSYDEHLNEQYFQAPIGIPDGSFSAPGLFPIGAPTTGIFRSSTYDGYSVAVDGQWAIRVGHSGTIAFLDILDDSDYPAEYLRLQKTVDGAGQLSTVGTARDLILQASNEVLLKVAGSTLMGRAFISGGTCYLDIGDDGTNILRLYRTSIAGSWIGHHGSAGPLEIANETADAINFRTNATYRWVMDSSGHLYPYTTDSVTLGASGKQITSIYLSDGALLHGFREQFGGAYVNPNGITAALAIEGGEYRSAATGTIVAAYAKRTGGTGATVNVQNAGSDIRSSDLSLTTTAWTSFGTLQNTSISAGNDVVWDIASVTGSPTQISFLLVIQRET